jgi:rsbT co-antagonist protein RsbR
MSLADRLAALDRSVVPVWVYDHDFRRFRWANAAALELWQAASREELLARDFSSNSESTTTRLDNYLAVLRDGGRVSEDWTLYPRGQPATMVLHGSGVELDDGRLAILFQAVLKETPIEASMIRGVEALRHTSLMVSLLRPDGAPIFHNPAALRAFGDAAGIDGWFADTDALLAAAARGEDFAGERRVRRRDGERWHSLRATPVVDPVTGERSVLLQQLDIHQRRQAEDVADELRRTMAVVDAQRLEILALSAPLLDVGEHVLAVPLIGALTPERVREIAERLLPTVQRDRRRHVILDLTGANEIDAAGARALGDLTAAIGLLGARVVLTGIRPALAQAIVDADLDRNPQRTLRTLREGIEHCRDHTPRR